MADKKLSLGSLNLNPENKIALPVEEQHRWLCKIFQVSITTPPQTGFKYLPLLHKQLNDVAALVGAFGGTPYDSCFPFFKLRTNSFNRGACFLNFGVLNQLLNELAPNEKGFLELLRCEARLLVEMKKVKKL